MNKEAEENTYDDFIRHAEQFHNAAIGGRNRTKVFTSEIMYNIMAMAIEKYFMGVLLYNKDLADNHTFQDLIDSARRVATVDDDIVEELKSYEKYQNLCPAFEGFFHHETSWDVIDQMLGTTEKIKLWALRNCGM